MEFGILGPLEVRRDGRLVPVGGPKARAVLAALVVAGDEPVSAERLAIALWGDDAPAAAVRTIQVHVSRLRKALGPDAPLVTVAGGYRLDVAPDAVDARRFEALLEQARSAEPEAAWLLLSAAEELWRGEPLADVLDAPFAPAEAGRLRDLRLEAFEARADAGLAVGRHADLLIDLQRLAAQHPAREQLTRLLMLALYRDGRHAEALDAFRRLREHLADELGLEPSPELRELEQAILTHDAGLRLARDRPPEPAAPLVGRESEVREVAALLSRPGTRLVTILGSGGAGKTRLALELARRSTGRVAWVELAGLAGAADVPGALCAALGVQVLAGESPRQALLRFVAEKELLLVLDNFEHVLGAAVLVAEVLEHAPGVVVLATSREALGVAAEQRYAIGALPQGDAAELFRRAASRRDSAFEPDDAVEAICRRLDGLPLALELAAARIGVLSTAQIAGRLDDALGVLGSGPRDAPQRQRTLRATLDWSHDLLGEEDRQAFRRLSVFAGGATAEAAQDVAGVSLDALESLVSKSLLARRGDRLVLHEVVRQYASERLGADREGDEVRARHCRHFTALAEVSAPQLLLAGRPAALARLDAEADNLRTALDWAITRSHADLALRLASALAEFWLWRSANAEGLRRLDAALALTGAGAEPSLRAAALIARCFMRDWGFGDTPAAQAAEEDATVALQLYRDAGDRGGMARSLNALAAIAMHAGAWPRLVELADAAAVEARAAGDELAGAIALGRRACAARTVAEARLPAEPALATLRRLGAMRPLGMLLSPLGFLAISAEAYDDAQAFLREALPAVEAAGVPSRIALVHGNLGLAALLSGHVDEAETAFGRQLALCAEWVLDKPAAEGLAGMAAVAASRGRPLVAARLSGAAERLGFRAEGAEAPVYRRLQERFLAPARDAVGPERWDAAATEGARLRTSDAIDEALDTLTRHDESRR